MNNMCQRILQRLTMEAAHPISRGELVKLSSEQGQVVKCDKNGEDAWGVAEHSAQGRETISVVRGLVWALAGANLFVGDDVSVGQNARVVGKTGPLVIGKALMAGADGELMLIDTERRRSDF